MTANIELLNQHFAATYEAWVPIVDTLKADIAGLTDDAFLTERPATKFILTWMRNIGEFQTKFGKLFGRKKRPSKADDFTAAVSICLKQFLDARGLAARVASEEATHRAIGSKRPDISVYSSFDQLLATVECKTNLGWNRKKWKDQFDQRTEQMRVSCPSSELFLCVLTRSGWDYSEFERSPLYGKQWFCLSTMPVGHISDPIADSNILLPIEPMFLNILEMVCTGYVKQILQLSPDDQVKILRILQGYGGQGGT